MATFIGILKVIGVIAGGIAALYGLIALIAYIALSISEYRSKKNTPILDGIGKFFKYSFTALLLVFFLGGILSSFDNAEEAYSDGYSDGFEDGYDEAYDNAYESGYWDGFDEGYLQALADYGIE